MSAHKRELADISSNGFIYTKSAIFYTNCRESVYATSHPIFIQDLNQILRSFTYEQSYRKSLDDYKRTIDSDISHIYQITDESHLAKTNDKAVGFIYPTNVGDVARPRGDKSDKFFYEYHDRYTPITKEWVVNCLEQTGYCVFTINEIVYQIYDLDKLQNNKVKIWMNIKSLSPQWKDGYREGLLR